MTVKRYPATCASCGGSGSIHVVLPATNTAGVTTVLCPSCGGTGSMLVEEYIYDTGEEVQIPVQVRYDNGTKEQP
jgi:DnaJ-class molecular chaperone